MNEFKQKYHYTKNTILILNIYIVIQTYSKLINWIKKTMNLTIFKANPFFRSENIKNMALYPERLFSCKSQKGK
jgi:hypothetical protein